MILQQLLSQRAEYFCLLLSLFIQTIYKIQESRDIYTELHSFFFFGFQDLNSQPETDPGPGSEKCPVVTTGPPGIPPELHSDWSYNQISGRCSSSSPGENKKTLK